MENPIYFFLGTNKKFEEQKLNKRYKIKLENIASEHVSITYGDSMLAFIKENKDLSGSLYKNPLCGVVYRLEELESIYSSIHYPTENQLAIEVQLWTMPSPQFIEI